MSSSESAQSWLEKGAEAFANRRPVEAAHNFEKAAAADPHSAKAQLCLGAIYLFQYQKGVAERLDPALRPPTLTPAEFAARAERRRAQIAEQNATNAASAEQHLKQALELEPRDLLAMEYLAALYFQWLHPAPVLPPSPWSGDFCARRDDAKEWYQRILEIDPQHRFANYVCGAMDYDKAMPIISSVKVLAQIRLEKKSLPAAFLSHIAQRLAIPVPATIDLLDPGGTVPPNTGFPTDEEIRRSLRAKVGPLLANSTRSFLRSLEIEPNNKDAMRYLSAVKTEEAYIAETNDESERAKNEAVEWDRRWDQIMAARAKAAGQPWPPQPGATGKIVGMVFQRIPGARKPPTPSFPPDPSWMIPLAPPHLPPPPPAFKR
jgi:tetratricopeptide (TPR) repeat protein